MLKKYNYFKHVVKDNYSIKQTLLHLEKLDPNFLKFCIVKNKNSKIIGVLTDGDIRRILLKSNNLNEKISSYLKKRNLFFHILIQVIIFTKNYYLEKVLIFYHY